MTRLALILIFAWCAFSFAEPKVLHVSTIPNHADIYVNEVQPNHAKEPAFVSPAFITVDDGSAANEMLISLFNPGFVDTTLRVKLSDKDTSYIIVSQMPVIADDITQEQKNELSKRSRRNFGKGMMKFSIVPFVVGLVAGSITYYEIEQAKKERRTLENSSIKNSDYNETSDQFKDHRDTAKNAKRITYGAFISGAALLSIGFILSF